MRRRPGTLACLAALFGCGLFAMLLVSPARAPATRSAHQPTLALRVTPQGGLAPVLAVPAPFLPVRRLLLPRSQLLVGERLHRLDVPPPLPPREHRLHLIAPTLALLPFEPASIPSDAAPRLYGASPATGRRMGAPHLLTPGALPDGFRFHYADDYTGWPVAPLHGPHLLHGAFNDPREGGYHFGIDIAVDDSKPAELAPPGMSHRIFAVESGVVHYPRSDEMSLNCNDRRFQIGQFSYWHASPEWAEGTYVRAGDMIGWTCLNEWHVHLSEWALVNGQRTWVNPLHAGGKLRPYADTATPVIRAVYAYGPPAAWWSPPDSRELVAGDGALTLALDNLRGAVDLRAWIDDSQGEAAGDGEGRGSRPTSARTASGSRSGGLRTGPSCGSATPGSLICCWPAASGSTRTSRRTLARRSRTTCARTRPAAAPGGCSTTCSSRTTATSGRRGACAMATTC